MDESWSSSIIESVNRDRSVVVVIREAELPGVRHAFSRAEFVVGPHRGAAPLRIAPGPKNRVDIPARVI